jgi:hypothetical protein
MPNCRKPAAGAKPDRTTRRVPRNTQCLGGNGKGIQFSKIEETQKAAFLYFKIKWGMMGQGRGVGARRDANC